jgi:hypothetical protein
LRKVINILLIPCLSVTIIAACSNQKTSTATAIQEKTDLERALSWLPADTETLLVSNGPFWMSNFQTGQDSYTNHDVTTEELEKQFEGLTLGLFNTGKGLLEKHLEGKKVLFAIEGSRHFRPPAGLGELPFEGCALAIFEDNLDDRRDAFMKDAVHVAIRFEQIERQRVAVLQQEMEQDVWTIYVAFPQKRVALVATNKEFLQEMLVRMRGSGGERALPGSLREWKYVNTQAQFWGLRHFDKQQASKDPTSPFGGRKSANLPDDGAIGLTYQCGSRKDRTVSLVYLSTAKAIGKIEAARFPSSSERENTAALHIQRRLLEPGAIQSTYDLRRSEPLKWFFFVFMASVGHAVYI